VNGPRSLDLGVFAIVMGTGIVAVDMRNHELPGISAGLFAVAAVAYVLLIVLILWRLIAFPTEVRADLADPGRGFASLTFVAATNVLGVLAAADGERGIALGLLGVGAVGWLLLGYAVPWAMLLHRDVRPAAAETNGTWFLWVVAVQSVAVLAASVEPTARTARPELALLAVACWSIGVVLYGGVALFVASGLMLRRPDPAELAPTYWVAMGATAITTVAGARITEMASAPAVDVTRGLAAAVSVVAFAFGTWLIPPLLAVGWWRHVRHGVALRYETTWWSIVFPVGMYSAAGHDLGVADGLPFVAAVGDVAGWAALAAWLIAFVIMGVDLAGRGARFWRRREGGADAAGL
jgi:tellurite resistance protein TehA-like permease